MQNKFRFHIIVKVMDAFWNGKISIGIEFYIIADTRCLCIVYILILQFTNFPFSLPFGAVLLALPAICALG